MSELQKILFLDPFIKQDLEHAFVNLRDFARDAIKFTLFMDLVEERLFSRLCFNLNIHEILYIHIYMVVVQINFLHTVLQLGAILILGLLEAVLGVQLLNFVFLANIFVQVLVELKITGYEVRIIPTLIINDLSNYIFSLKLIFVRYLVELLYEN